MRLFWKITVAFAIAIAGSGLSQGQTPENPAELHSARLLKLETEFEKLQQQVNDVDDAVAEIQEGTIQNTIRESMSRSVIPFSFVSADNFMPPPAEPSLLLRDEIAGRTNLGAGTRIGSGDLVSCGIRWDGSRLV